MKNSLAIKFQFDTATIRRSLAVVTGKPFSDQEIKDKFVHIFPVEVDSEKEMGGESLQMCIAFLATIIAHKYPELLVQEDGK